MNVIIAGESGIGKSSLINLITDQEVAQTSNDSTACTLQTRSYKFSIDGHDFLLWDTPGFDEGSMTVANARFPELMVRTLVQRLKNAGGIDLLVYCMHGNRAKTGLVNSYKLIRSLVPTTVPFVAVVTRLERYPNQMEDWWAKNEHELSNFGMEFADHACITALPDSSTLPPLFRERLSHSRTTVQDLIRTNCCPYAISPTLVSFPSPPTTDDWLQKCTKDDVALTQEESEEPSGARCQPTRRETFPRHSRVPLRKISTLLLTGIRA